MTKQDEQWDDLVKGWQGTEFESANDTAILQAKVKSSGNKMMFESVVNVTVGLGLSAYIVFELMQGLPSLLDVATYSVVLFIALLMTVTSVWMRRGNYSALVKDSQSYMQLMLKRTQSTLKLTKASQLFCAALFIGFEGLFAFLFAASFLSGHDMAKPGLAAGIMAFVTVFFPSMYYFLSRYAVKVSAEKERIEGMLADVLA
jgi:hypothetical protein